MSTEKIGTSRRRSKLKSSTVAREPEFVSYSRPVQAIKIDTDGKQCTQWQAETEDKTPNTNLPGKIGPHDNSEMQYPATYPISNLFR